MVAFVLQWQSCLVITDTKRPPKPKIFTLWPFTDKVDQPLVCIIGVTDLGFLDSLFCCSFLKSFVVFVLCFGFLTMRHMESELPDQGSNPHPLHRKVES